MKRNKILLLEDEDNIRSFVRLNLMREGYEVIEASLGEEAIAIVDNNGDIDIAILDIMLPDISGLDVLEHIKSISDMGTIVLSARGHISDKIDGLRLGADDYIVKPFSPIELVLRVNSLLKRLKAKGDDEICTRLDTDTKLLIIEGEEIELTSTEYSIVELLINNPGKSFSRDALLDRVWGEEYVGGFNILDVNISRLRKKIRGVTNMNYILTKRGHGYHWKDKD